MRHSSRRPGSCITPSAQEEVDCAAPFIDGTVAFTSVSADISFVNCSGDEVDKFKRFRLTPVPGAKVAAPLIRECFANLECRIADARLVKVYNFFILGRLCDVALDGRDVEANGGGR